MLKKGKKPLDSRSDPVVRHEDIFGNVLGIPKEIQADLDNRGLSPRWVDYEKMKSMDGYHAKGWVLYKKQKSDIIESQETRLGSGPEGLVRRGTMVLATKTKEAVAKHREFLNHRAITLKANFNKKAAEELRQAAKSANVETRITEGYDDDQ